jgi:hypothetical protein
MIKLTELALKNGAIVMDELMPSQTEILFNTAQLQAFADEYLALSSSEPVAEDGFQVTMSNTPMYKQAYDLIQSIESLGASPELTAVVTQAGKLMDEILKREMNFHHVCKAFNEINAPTFMGEPKLAAPQQAIPSGWKLVPIEPTDEMKEKGWEAYRDSNKPAPYNMLTDAYKAMLTASPTAPIESDK